MQALNLPNYQRHLYLLAAILFTFGFIYFFAANWFALPKMVQLLLPQGLLLVGCGCASYFVQNPLAKSISLAFSGILIGLSLVSFSQIYQTGADSYLLFLLWALLLLPFILFVRNGFLFVLFFCLLLMTQFLAAKQIIYHSIFYNPAWYFIILSCLVLYACQHFYPKIQWIILIIIGFCSILMSITYAIDVSILLSNFSYGQMAPIYTIIFLLPILFIGYFRFIKHFALIPISLIIFILNTSIFIIQNKFQSLGDLTTIANYVHTIFIILLLAFAGFFILQKIMGKNMTTLPSWLKQLPLRVSGWFSALFIIPIIFLSKINPLEIGFIGVIILVGCYFFLRKTHNIYLKNLLYCILLIGEITFCICFTEYRGFKTTAENYFIFQLILSALCILILPKPWWCILQAITLSFIAALAYINANILFSIILLGLLFYFPEVLKKYQAQLACFIALITLGIFTFCFYNTIYYRIAEELFSFPPKLRDVYQPIVFFVTIIWLFTKGNFLPLFAKISFILFFALLTYFYLLHMTLLFLLLLFACNQQNRFYSIGIMCTLFIQLTLFYYNLNLPLLQKAITISFGGLLIALVSYSLTTAKQNDKELFQ